MNSKQIIVGRFGKTYGIQGWLRVNSFTAPKENILGYGPWLIEDKSQWMPLRLTETRPHGSGLVVHIVGYDTPEAASTLTNKDIVVAKDQLPALQDDEYYWTDLEGLSVVTVQGVSLGEVDYLIESGANDLFVVKKEGQKDLLIPYLPNDVVLNIDMDKKIITVDWDPDY